MTKGLMFLVALLFLNLAFLLRPRSYDRELTLRKIAVYNAFAVPICIWVIFLYDK